MKTMRVMKGVLAIAAIGVIGVGAMTAIEGGAAAAPRPLCGYSLLWNCTLPNGTHKLVGGTVCDIQKYEQQTGATCVPSGL